MAGFFLINPNTWLAIWQLSPNLIVILKLFPCMS